MFLVLNDEDRESAKSGIIVGAVVSVGMLALGVIISLMLAFMGSATT